MPLTFQKRKRQIEELDWIKKYRKKAITPDKRIRMATLIHKYSEQSLISLFITLEHFKMVKILITEFLPLLGQNDEVAKKMRYVFSRWDKELPELMQHRNLDQELKSIQSQQLPLQKKDEEKPLKDYIFNYLDIFKQKTTNKQQNAVLSLSLALKNNNKFKNIFEEISTNWLKMQLQNLTEDKSCNISNLCCKNAFIYKGKYRYTQKKHQKMLNIEMKKAQDFENRDEISNLIRQYCIAFLNDNGGFVYLGFKLIPNSNQFIVEGTPFEDHIIKKFLSPVIGSIRPEIQMNNRLEDQLQNRANNVLEISELVYVDLLPVIDERFTFLINEDQSRVHVIRLKLKAGISSEVYHHVNRKIEYPEAYFRVNMKLATLTFKQFYEEIYQREEHKDQKTEKRTIKLHPNCHFHLVKEAKK